MLGHITILLMVTANGDYMPSLFILPLKNLPRNLDSMVAAGQIYVSGQKCGWITMETFLAWSKIFVKWVKDRRSNLKLPQESPFLLFLDNHSSRASIETLQFLKDDHICVVSYPSHCSHLLQPLDVAVFGQFKKHFKLEKRSMSKVEIVWEGEKDPSQ